MVSGWQTGNDDEQRGCGRRGDSQRVRKERETTSWCGPTRWAGLMVMAFLKKKPGSTSIHPRIDQVAVKASWRPLTRPSQQIRIRNCINGPKWTLCLSTWTVVRVFWSSNTKLSPGSSLVAYSEFFSMRKLRTTLMPTRVVGAKPAHTPYSIQTTPCHRMHVEIFLDFLFLKYFIS